MHSKRQNDQGLADTDSYALCRLLVAFVVIGGQGHVPELGLGFGAIGGSLALGFNQVLVLLVERHLLLVKLLGPGLQGDPKFPDLLDLVFELCPAEIAGWADHLIIFVWTAFAPGDLFKGIYHLRPPPSALQTRSCSSGRFWSRCGPGQGADSGHRGDRS